MSGTGKTLVFLTAIAGGISVGATLAQASGFQLKEQGASLQGLSFAGATAKADDLSTLFFNPAGMSRLDGTQGEANVTYIRTSAQATPTSASGGGANPVAISDGDGGDAGGGTAVPSLYAMYQLNDDWRFGLSVNTPFGLSTEYDEDWVGRYHAIKSEVKTVATSPMLSYQATDRLSVGFGPVVQYIEGELTKAVNVAGFGLGSSDGYESQITADDYGYGVQGGLLYEFDADSRVGLSYRSQIKHKLDGDITLRDVPSALGESDGGHMNLTTPDIVSIGAYHALNDKWAVLSDLSWTNWSTFNELRIHDDAGEVRTLVREEWRDTYFVSVGTEYKPTRNWTLKTGVAFDKSPIKDSFRTFRIPGSDRYWLSAGAGYELDDNFSFNLSYTHIIAKDVSVTEEETSSRDGTVTADYDSDVNIIAANISYKF